MGNGCIRADNELNLDIIQSKKEPISTVYKRNASLQNKCLNGCDGRWNTGINYYHSLYFRYNTPQQFLPPFKPNKKCIL